MLTVSLFCNSNIAGRKAQKQVILIFMYLYNYIYFSKLTFETKFLATCESLFPFLGNPIGICVLFRINNLFSKTNLMSLCYFINATPLF